MWVNFSDRKPKKSSLLITRSPGYDKQGDCFEDWRMLADVSSYNPPPSHWWDGKQDFDLAVESWKRS